MGVGCQRFGLLLDDLHDAPSGLVGFGFGKDASSKQAGYLVCVSLQHVPRQGLQVQPQALIPELLINRRAQGAKLDVEVSAPEHLTHAGVLALIEVDQGAFTGNKHHHVLVDKKDYA